MLNEYVKQVRHLRVVFIISILTKRDELLLRTVLALPYASNAGLACTIWSSSDPFFCTRIKTHFAIS